jgi:capsular exopolysaccharide synthesis family protein
MAREKGYDMEPGEWDSTTTASGQGTAATSGSATPGRTVTSLPSVHRRLRDNVEQLWGTVFYSAEQAAPRSVVITAAEPREGVTQVAAALAVTGSSAERDMKIALVDLHFRRPRIGQLFGLPSGPGVSGAAEVLAGEVPLNQALASGADGRLSILPAGEIKNGSAPSFQPDKLQELLHRLCEEHDHVLIDTPPINRQATAQALLPHADGVLLVTKSGSTRRESVAEAKKRVELAHGKILGLVLNQRRFPIPGFLYRRL